MHRRWITLYYRGDAYCDIIKSRGEGGNRPQIIENALRCAHVRRTPLSFTYITPTSRSYKQLRTSNVHGLISTSSFHGSGSNFWHARKHFVFFESTCETAGNPYFPLLSNNKLIRLQERYPTIIA